MRKIEGVDSNTFVPVNPKVPDNDYGIAWEKDKDSVFRKNIKLVDADTSTFTMDFSEDEFYNYWSKDKNHVYYGNTIVNGLDSSSFVIITDGSQKDCGSFTYVKDKNSIYWKDKKIEGADVVTFEVLGMNYSHDKTHVYYGNTIQPDRDTKTFKPECDIGLKNYSNTNS